MVRMSRMMFVVIAFVANLSPAFSQSRSDFATRFGKPWTETFLVLTNVKLNIAYGPDERVCSLRMETLDHSQRVAPNLSDGRYWIDAEQVTRLLTELVPDAQRKGPVQHGKIGLRHGEFALIASDDSVQIERIQRSSILAFKSTLPVADRLVTVKWKRPECQSVLAAKKAIVHTP
jgi:hypothetical protein